MKESRNQSISIGEAAQFLHVEVPTVRKYSDKGLLPCVRTPGGNRRYYISDLKRFRDERLSQRHLREDPSTSPEAQAEKPKETIVFYIRTSNGNRDLMKAQEDELRAAYGEPKRIYRDAGSGLNENRKNLKRLITDARKGQYDVVCVTYLDRLTRFGGSYLQTIFDMTGVELRSLHEKQNGSPEEELTSDFMKLISSFSGRFYHLRNRANQRKLLQLAEHELDDNKNDDDSDENDTDATDDTPERDS